ncbi:hypothetical protein E2C01_053628 [Portunus trituberculatus]|uniref:Uncharacterized protein n=1 Tax=Portunus trituberculatus TaxID=210409 RepID=A0A5B7GST3_PORTR|nr:hypothetical protein [Portunus trituberculatus]
MSIVCNSNDKLDMETVCFDACYRVPSHDVMGYLSTHWPKPPSRQDQFGYRVFGYGAAISGPIGHDN